MQITRCGVSKIAFGTLHAQLSYSLQSDCLLLLVQKARLQKTAAAVTTCTTSTDVEHVA